MTQPDVPAPEILLHADADAVAEALAARLLARITELQGGGRVPQVCLTGGRIATRAYGRLAAEGRSSAVDWGRVELWWGDERFVPAGDDDRNDAPVLELLRPLGLAAERVHPMPAPDGGAGLDDAAAGYASELGGTRFDVCLLGLGPDGHVASLFPEHPSSHAEGRVVAVRNAPKPPPDRISLTLEVINASAEVWFLVSGEDKADATALALQGAGPVQVPGAGAHGRSRTLWLLDHAAAGRLPPDLAQRGRF
ncbi:6-phosphogluconolactonase [Friedmanniella luteola]|uniref:6-phosphogluconolactonase n=1 Tax=Friedmanniella luteola TaxID=546871 RepID=A0A1H1PJM8_9ACTN|nr:6-phosphogluconolactonase [Friedmanniella luteola]SDS11354.1 6-phosphogluconolactonase [Friedmanniella luteola]